jgi:hypothetical protein
LSRVVVKNEFRARELASAARFLSRNHDSRIANYPLARDPPIVVVAFGDVPILTCTVLYFVSIGLDFGSSARGDGGRSSILERMRDFAPIVKPDYSSV